MRNSYKSVLSSIACSVFITLSFPALANAQDIDTNVETEDEEIVLDSVTVTGVQNDAAMAAFRAGDYVTAEVEFLDNAMCALRRERNLSATVENARISAQRAETFANSTGSNSGASTRGVGAGAQTDTPTGIAASSGVAARNAQTKLDRTCEKRGRQLYFAGLSQIQLGKTEEALRSFEKATVASKILYDAHYKIGLIKILGGDNGGAKSELAKIEQILARCRGCEAKQEIIDRRDHLSKAIGGQVSMQ